MANVTYHDCPPPCAHDFVLESVDERGVKRSKCRHCQLAMLDYPPIVPIAPRPSSTDARAQLWARVYGDVRLHGGRGTTEAARKYAIVAANDAVADFDEHYLGGKR